MRIPNDWRPRAYQARAWDYLQHGGKRLVQNWHRRSGKDSLALNWTAVQAVQRPAVYWHMLPVGVQARKAIWEAVNPHNGRRFIDQVFPPEIRETTRENEMTIRLKNGAMWQVVGSDNYNKLVGSPPLGVVLSEFALSKPSAWDYLRPILAENGGWAIFPSTPRGRNHFHRLYEMSVRNPEWFGQTLTVRDTNAIPMSVIDEERESGMPEELIEQEYFCSFAAALVGAYYGRELEVMERTGRMVDDLYDDALDVVPVFDLGYDDDTAIWFMQVHRDEVRFVDSYSASGEDVEHYAQVLIDRGYRFAGADRNSRGVVWLPHDGKAKTLAARGKSVEQQFRELGFRPRIVPHLSVQDGIQAVRKTLKRAYFDPIRCEEGLEALKQYQRAWDQDKRTFGDHPMHDWTSHYADAARYAAIVWRDELAKVPAPEPRFALTADRSPSFDQLRGMVSKRRIGRDA